MLQIWQKNLVLDLFGADVFDLANVALLGLQRKVSDHLVNASLREPVYFFKLSL